jgi:4-oxalocrotonate tautomerase
MKLSDKLKRSQQQEPAMPHVDIKCFPRDLNDEQKTALAADIAEVIIRHFNSKDSSVSVALNQVQQEDWKAQVWDTEIGPKLDELIKKPGYSM